jgi:hypothetical protein
VNGPVLVAEPPPGWVAAEVPRPVFSEDTTTTLPQWTALASPGGNPTLLTACAATPIPGWVEDMRTPIANRSIGFVASTAERMTGVPTEARPDGRVFVLRAAGAPAGAPHLGTAQTWLGFDAGHVFNCFVICASRPRTETAPLACERSVDVSHLEGGSDPPPPGAILRATTWAVHHSFPTASGAAILLALAAALAVARRRKPRARIR